MDENTTRLTEKVTPNTAAKSLAEAINRRSQSLQLNRGESKLDDDLQSEQRITDPLIGKLFAQRYELSELLGEGGWGLVYKARHNVLKRSMAIKILHPHMALQPEVRKRFAREAEAMSRLEHPNVIAVHDFGTCDDGQYMVMELLDGVPLSFIVETDGAYKTEDALPLFIQTAGALSHAHQRGVIHRDLKPGNLMLTQAANDQVRVTLLDFGLSKPLGDDTSEKLTATGIVFGTPFYMSPEQCRGQQLDERSDIYAFGILMYEVVTGTVPFTGEVALEVINKHLNDQPKGFQNISAADPFVRQQMERIISKCLQKDPGKRYQSVAQIEEQLNRLAMSLESKPGTVERAGSWLSLGVSRAISMASHAYSNKAMLALHITVVLLAVAVGSLFFLSVPDQTASNMGIMPIPLIADKAADPTDLRAASELAAFGLKNIGNQNSIEYSNAAFSRGFVEMRMQHYSAAIPYLIAAVKLRQNLGASFDDTSTAMKALGHCFYMDGKYRDARVVYSKLLDMAKQMGTFGTDQIGCTPLLELGDIFQRERDLSRASDVFHSVIATFPRETESTAIAQTRIAEIEATSGKPAQAQAAYTKAIELWKTVGETGLHHLALTELQLCRLSADRKDAENISTYYRQAISILRTDPAWKVELKNALQSYSAFLWQHGRFLEAMDIKSQSQKL